MDRRIKAQIARQARRDTPEEIAWRFRQRAASEQIHRERAERYPVITADNLDEALAWQERRFEELMREE